MSYVIKEQTSLPTLRMIQVEEEVNTGVVVHNRPFNSEFNITYILSNRNNIRLKGEIKAVWERTFDYLGNTYRPSDKKKIPSMILNGRMRSGVSASTYNRL